MDSSERHRPEDYRDLATVNSQKNDIIAEEFPDGPYGSIEQSLGKSTPWREGQRATSPFGVEYIELHRGIPRDYPGEDLQEGVTEEFDSDLDSDVE